jgi:hypothetical protein
MNTGADTLGTVEKEFGSTKQENGSRRPPYRRKIAGERKTLKWEPTASVPPKASPNAQNMKTIPDTLGTVE